MFFCSGGLIAAVIGLTIRWNSIQLPQQRQECAIASGLFIAKCILVLHFGQVICSSSRQPPPSPALA
jgi:hypothetical protein